MKAYIVQENESKENKGAFYNKKSAEKWLETENLDAEKYTIESLDMKK